MPILPGNWDAIVQPHTDRHDAEPKQFAGADVRSWGNVARIYGSRKFREMEMLKMCMALMRQKENGKGREDTKITRGLSRGSAAVYLPRFWVQIPPVAWISVSCEFCLCVGLITRPEEYYQVWCV